MAAMRFRRVREHAPMSRAQHDGCDHGGLIEVERSQACYRVRCAVCGKTGPARSTPEAARKALRVLGARDVTNPSTRVPRG